MELFWRLALGHLIADFTLQTNYIAAWKRRNVWGLLVHCGTHPIVYTILLWKYIGQVWIQIGPLQITGCTCVVLIFLAHFIEDEWRIWSVLHRGAPDNTFFYLWDQVIHYAVLFAVSPVVDGSIGKFEIFKYPPITGVIAQAQAVSLSWQERFLTVADSERWVLIAILFVILTHFTTVTIYFIEKDYLGKDFPSTHEKYIAMAERLVIAVCFLLPGIWWISVVGVWLLRAVIYKFRRLYDFSWINIVLGNSSAIICGVLGRFFLYS